MQHARPPKPTKASLWEVRRTCRFIGRGFVGQHSLGGVAAGLLSIFLGLVSRGLCFSEATLSGWRGTPKWTPGHLGVPPIFSSSVM